MRAFENAEDFLKYAHSKSTGDSAEFFDYPVEPKPRSGLSSYHLLVDLVKERDACVLDLACGDGILTQKLLRAQPLTHPVLCVDMSADELRLAERRLAGLNVRLERGRAQELSAADSSLDYVLCHMALMLMDQIERVSAEIRRVLRPGGVFSAIVGSAWEQGPVLKAFQEELGLAESQGFKEASFPAIGDPRIRSAEGIASLFGPETGYALPPSFVDIRMNASLPPERMTEFFATTYYAVSLTAEGARRFRAGLCRRLEALAGPDGNVAYSMFFRQVIARR